MLRCPNHDIHAPNYVAPGRYRVSLRIPHHKEPYKVQIGGHGPVYVEAGGVRQLAEEGPTVSTTEPFEGELCLCEVQWLTEGVPGRDYRPEYEFTVKKL